MLAQLDLDKIQKEANPDFTTTTIGDVITSILPYLFTGAGLVLLLYLILGGLQLMTSRGDPKAVEAAKGKITNALLGFIVVFASFWIVQLVGRFLGIEVFQNIFG